MATLRDAVISLLRIAGITLICPTRQAYGRDRTRILNVIRYEVPREPVQPPSHTERLISMMGRFAKRVRSVPLIPAACVTILLAGCGSGTPERVPASARVLIVTVTYGPGAEPPLAGSQPARPVSVAVTNLARVRQVSALLDGLSLASPGEEWSCPAFTDGVVNLAFKNSASGRTLAAAEFNMSGCPDVDLAIAGHQQGLIIPSATFPSHVLQIAGIRAATGS